jgi:ATP-dependent Clp protease ATP-binding subunit ClpA
MLCSICNKNLAVIFAKKVEGDKSVVEGFCYNCAKERGINPLEMLAKQANLSEGELNDMTKQFENMFEDLSENIDMNELELENVTGQELPFGSIISNLFGTKPENNAKQEETNNTKKVKTEKRPKEKKKSFLDIYGINLTNKAKKGLLDNVIGRDKELQRVIQILNRRLKNNPCLIGEPGVRQNRNCSRFGY